MIDLEVLWLLKWAKSVFLYQLEMLGSTDEYGNCRTTKGRKAASERQNYMTQAEQTDSNRQPNKVQRSRWEPRAGAHNGGAARAPISLLMFQRAGIQNIQSPSFSFVFSSLDSRVIESKEADEQRAGKSEDNEIVMVITTCENTK